MLKIEYTFQNKTSILYFLPFFPENLETTQAILKTLSEIKPQVVALTLPFFVKDKWIEAVNGLPDIYVLTLTYKTNEMEYLLISPICALVEGTRFALSNNIILSFIDLPKETPFQEIIEPPLPLYLIKNWGYKRYTEKVFSFLPKHITQREKFIGERVFELVSKYSSIAIILPFYQLKSVLEAFKNASGLLYLPKDIPKNIEIFSLHTQSIRELLSEPAYFQSAYEKNRKKFLENSKFYLDRITLYEEIIEKAQEKYRKETGIQLSIRDFNVFGQFLRNFLLIKGRYIPDLFDLVLTARGIGGDEFAFWLWEIATYYDLQNEKKYYPVLKLSAEELNLPTKKLRLFRKIKSIRSCLRFLKRFTTREERRNLVQSFSGKVICSFPPEDIIVETFGKKAMEKGLRVITENLRKIEPFTTSLKDGLDIRETIRKWIFEETPYVKEDPQTHAKAGSIVIIFEEDPNPVTGRERYPWNFTWHGEHHQESDMAFYATDPSLNIVGPGIAKAKYGGFMLTYPPMRVYDVWEDSYFDIAENKAERLLLAGIDYSLEKYIVYIAKKPPSQLVKRFANFQGKKIIFIPIGSFSKTLLEKIRIFHVLEGHYVRSYAHKYINK
ncbi:hypothetical protein [Thermodesulfobacterium hydrogeniphilum]|uniref:hypothetical protein n=1 Tax=Thermodesulfobacterium hydrogeniphilum TaxID=161156 RepID=UPI00056EF89F|nr:hypothetical protein [Thermodesulfobacterium hydrogeniphilum]